MSKTSKSTTMTIASTTPIHPGQYVRNSALTPKNLSVLAAAKLVGVGRPALSNFLNGRASVTQEMASRIEIAFGIPAQNLLDMQAMYDAANSKSKGALANAKPYVVPFLGIKAKEIETWVERNISARPRLSVLLRTLINSTGNSITKIDFPGNDDAERPGWDGYIDSEQPTPWIPDGLSGWEFGTNQNIKEKADGDFSKSVKANPDKAERDTITFVFVTPRHWPSKDDWIKKNKAKSQWKDVRAYDSSDLEQWLEQSISAQVWFSSETERPSSGVDTLDNCWTKWANVANPPLVGSLFAPAINNAKRTLLSRLTTPPNEPTVIAADSVEEGLAFLAQLFGPIGGEELERFRDRVLVFNEPGVLKKLAQGSREFIAVAANREVERELGPLSRTMNSIVIYPRNAANAEPHVILEPLNYESFRSSLEEMRYDSDDVTKYSSESGRSLTVLRRRLTNVPALRTPEWATEHNTATSLIPFLLVGAWSATNSTDQTVLTLLTNTDSYEELEKECQRLAGLNDAPLWSVGTYRGVISKIDLLFAIAHTITSQDLKRYFEIARLVLGEDDPSLDLPEAERWAASIHGKSREFSTALREGISETLVLLAVYGNHFFQARLGFNCELVIAKLVRDLLTPLKTRVLEANDRDLAAYAEAAPNEFLSILDEDLRTDNPQSYGLMRPADSGVFGGGCARSGLLWALEGLAWNPNTLPRTALILAQLAEIEIEDNWVNKPINSLKSIFRVWMPQTAADHDSRLRVMKLLSNKFPKVAWKICIDQLNTGHKTGSYSHKPRWRNDAQGFGEPFKTWDPTYAFMREMAEMALNWKSGYTQEMLCDLIQHLHDLSEEFQAKVWNIVKSWADTNASDSGKAFVREKIRVTIMSRRGVMKSQKIDYANLSAAARASYQALEPTDILNKHEWLFRNHWVEESAEELQNQDIDIQKREERIAKIRVKALDEIYESRGLAGIFELAEMGKVAHLIGALMTEKMKQEKDIPSFLLAALSPNSNSLSWSRKNLISGALRAMQDETMLTSVLDKIKKELSQADFVQLLLLAPFRRCIWQMVDKLDVQYRNTYWDGVIPDWSHYEDNESCDAVERLLAVQRPRAAFSLIHFNLNAIGHELLFRLMSEMAKNGNEQPGHYQLESYYIEQALSLLDKSSALTFVEKAGLEFVYIEALSKPWNGNDSNRIPNLEKYVEEHPEFFVQAVVWTYKRRGEGEDPQEWKVEPNQAHHLAERGYKLLEALGRIPGHDDFGVLQADKLATWVNAVQKACAELDRLEVADVCIGKLLSGAPMGNDGVWPCEPVRQVLEDMHSKDMINGAHTGLYNSRGVVTRGEGGNQERELAEKYRVWANALQYSHPYLASELLMGMVKSYEHEANREDTEARLRRRLN